MLVFSAFITGVLVGLTGVGGGSLMTPLLVLVFGWAPAAAVGTDLWFAAFTKLAASRMHHTAGLIDWQVVRRLWLGSLPAAALTLVVIKTGHLSLDITVIKPLIGGAVLITAGGMLLQKRLHQLGERLRLTHATGFKAWQPPLTVAAGVVLGVLVTLTSIGAGVLGAVMLTYLYPLRLTPARLAATDIVHAIPLAMLAGMGYLLLGLVNWPLLGWMLVGSLPGVLLGVYLSSRLPQWAIRLALAGVLCMVGIKMLLPA